MKHSVVRTAGLAITALAVLGPNPTVQAQACFNMQEGLISWWQAEDNGSDSTGANPADPLPCYAYDAGMKGRAFGFYGANQIVRIPNSPSLNPTNSLTVEAWVYVSDHSLNDSVVIIGKDDHYTWHQYMLGLTNANGRWIFQANVAATEGYKRVLGITEVLPRTWYHAAMTYDGQELRLYANGALEGTIPLTGPIPPTPNPLLFGGHATGPWGFFGRIDEASLHARALSPREIAGIHGAGSLGKCPLPSPTITLQPASQTVGEGDPVRFTAQATGYAPLTYQWRFDGADMAGATNPTLLLTNALPSMSGIYTIAVNSPGGMATSSNAVLTVLAAQCVPLPPGVAGWWKGEGNAADSAGTNNGTTGGGISYTRGMIGSGFLLDGTSGFVRITAATNLDLGRGEGLTIEAWINPADVGKGHPVVEWGGPAGTSGYGAHLWIGHPSRPQGYFLANIVDTNGNWHVIDSLPGTISTNRLQHVAVSYDKTTGLARLFLDGTVVSEANLGIFTPRTSQDMYIGRRPVAPSYFFEGLIDEVSVYNRALSPAEVKSISGARVFGKCPSVVAPAITSHPAPQSVDEGTSVTLSVQATGTAPLSYQWMLENAAIPGATNSLLILTNTLPAMSGNYSVAVANSGGRILSSNALVAILALPTNCVAAPAGIVGWWSAEGNALDVAGSSPTTGSINYTNGRVGQAFLLNGLTQGLTAAGSSNLAAQSLTIEAWVNPADSSVNPHPIVEYAAATGHASIHFWHNIMPGPVGVPGALYALIRGTNGTSLEVSSAGGLLPTNTWSHVALTFDSSTHSAQIYLNGTSVAANTTTNLVQPDTSLPVNIGVRPPGSAELLAGRRFVGALDEVAIYNRALTSGEIRTIHRTGGFGKCPIVVAPAITSHPAPQTVDEGAFVTLSVQATGTAPLSYQWLRENAAIAGATNSLLVLSNALPAMSGNYSVSVANSAGALVSSNAIVTILALPTNCVAAPAGIVGAWTAEGNALDALSSTPATGTVGYAIGRVGQAFLLNGTSNGLTAAASSKLAVQSITIEAWVNPADSSVNPRPIVEYAAASGFASIQLWHNLRPGPVGSPGALYAAIRGTNGPVLEVGSPAGLLPTNTWSHVALTFDHATHSAQIYLNGSVVASNSTTSVVAPRTSVAVNIGLRPPGSAELLPGRRFVGKLDEVAIYNRALSPAEVRSVHRTGSFGKCPVVVAPAITSQPASQTVDEGTTVTLAVQATGSAPLSYQWMFANTAIPEATNSVLLLSNTLPAMSGNYAVAVGNEGGSLISSNALLTVVALPTACIAAPAGLVGWWKGQDNGQDSAGTNHATIGGGLTFATGKVDRAFAFNSAGSFVTIPASSSTDVGTNGGFTAEAWIKPANTISLPVFEWSPDGAYGVLLYANQPTLGTLMASVVDLGGGQHVLQTASGTLKPGILQHVALTYDKASGIARLFLDGRVVVQSTVGSFTPKTDRDLQIGYRLPGAPYGEGTFSGLIDEASLYNRALLTNEVLSIYRAGGLGKCPTAPAIPSITTQPAGLTVNAGDVAIFTVQAAGSTPLSYQWQFGTTQIPGATTASLVLSNVQPSNAGPYSVLVSNPAGTVPSSNAILVVISPTNTCSTPPAGLVGWWPGDRSGTDIVFGNNAVSLGAFAPTYGYTGGKVGEAFDLATTLGLVVPASTNLAVQDLTIEAWINPNSTAQPTPVLEYGGSNTLASVSLWQSMAPGGFPNPGALYGMIRNIGGGGLEISTAPGLFRSNTWTHVALTFNSATRTAQIFVNGVIVATNTSATPIQPDTRLPINIGYRQIASAELLAGFRFEGGLDEVAIYNRALSGGEILSIHAAGSAGKCRPPHIGTAIVPPRRVSGGFNLSFKGDVGIPLQVQRADSLTGPWLPLGTVFIDGTGFGKFSDTNAPGVKAFYRTAQ